VSGPSTFELKRYYEPLNKTFRNFFTTRQCKHGSEELAVLVKDVGEYVRTQILLHI